MTEAVRKEVMKNTQKCGVWLWNFIAKHLEMSTMENAMANTHTQREWETMRSFKEIGNICLQMTCHTFVALLAFFPSFNQKEQQK